MFSHDYSGAVIGFRWNSQEGEDGYAPRAREAPFDQAEMQFVSGGVTLKGLVMTPRIRKLTGRMGRPLREVPIHLPGVVFIHGSGDSDRDNVWAFMIAQHLARNGFVVLLPDKRGSGGSGGDWRTADFADLARDALAGVEALKGRPEADGERIGLVGLSQGGWIAPLAASMSHDVAFVVDVSGAAVTPGEQVAHEVEQTLRQAGVPDPLIPEAAGLQELGAAFIRENSDSAWERYAARREAMLQGPLAAVAQEAPADRENWQWGWWRGVIDYDPLPVWESLDVPWLVVYGAEDERDNVPVELSVARLSQAIDASPSENRTVRVFEGSGHTLEDPETGWIRAGFLAFMVTWLDSVAGGAEDR